MQASCSALALPVPYFSGALGGHWVGTLEYRDFGNDRRVTLMTQRDIARIDASSLDFSHVYDDGPGKTVRETSHVSVDPAHRRYVVRDDDERDAYRIVEYSGFAENTDAGRMLLAGQGKGNAQPVVIRTSIVRSGSPLTILRESQGPGEPFKFRHVYRLTRTDPMS